MTAVTPGALFVVGGRPYVDSRTLHNLTRTHAVSTLAGGWRVQGPEGAVECFLSSRPPLPEQHGSLYEARPAAGVKLSDACATWLAAGAARIAGKFADWPSASCGCGATCGCGPCKQRHGHGADAPPNKVSDEDAAQFVLDAVPFRVGGFMPETVKRAPSGFFLHLYPEDGEYEEKAVTFEVEGRNALRIEWHASSLSSLSRFERARIVQTIDLLIQEAYDDNNEEEENP
jgi:hypothetical protein